MKATLEEFADNFDRLLMCLTQLKIL